MGAGRDLGLLERLWCDVEVVWATKEARPSDLMQQHCSTVSAVLLPQVILNTWRPGLLAGAQSAVARRASPTNPPRLSAAPCSRAHRSTRAPNSPGSGRRGAEEWLKAGQPERRTSTRTPVAPQVRRPCSGHGMAIADRRRGGPPLRRRALGPLGDGWRARPCLPGPAGASVLNNM